MVIFHALRLKWRVFNTLFENHWETKQANKVVTFGIYGPTRDAFADHVKVLSK